MAASRENWSGGLGFTLAAVGSAVGLGNMWRFSYMAAENGGAAFVVLYVIMTLAIGLPILLAEFALGRGSGQSPIGAFTHFGGERWRFAGAVFVAAPFLILSYYSVIAGWAVRYAVEAVLMGFPEDAGTRFVEVRSGFAAVAWHLAFIGATVAVVAGGVRRGIERASLLLMPALGVLVLGLAAYAATLDGASEGYRYYFQPSFADILDLDVATDAASQAFFSLSLGMGTMITYASYLSRQHHLPVEATKIAFSDFAVALIVGLVIFPLVFALGLQDDVVGGGGESSLGALFVVLPTAFTQLGDAGWIVGVCFMLVLSLAALTSAIGLLEVVVASMLDRWPGSRLRTTLGAGLAVALVGIPSALDIGFLDWLDSFAGAFLLVAGGLLIAVFVGWRMPDPISEAGEAGSLSLRAWRGLIRFVAPSVLLFMAYFLAEASFAKLRALLA